LLGLLDVLAGASFLVEDQTDDVGPFRQHDELARLSLLHLIQKIFGFITDGHIRSSKNSPGLVCNREDAREKGYPICPCSACSDRRANLSHVRSQSTESGANVNNGVRKKSNRTIAKLLAELIARISFKTNRTTVLFDSSLWPSCSA